MLLIIILIVINTHSGPIMEDTDPDPIMTRADDWNEPARQQIGLQRVPRAWLGIVGLTLKGVSGNVGVESWS